MGLRRFLKKILKKQEREQVFTSGYIYFKQNNTDFLSEEKCLLESSKKYLWQFWWQGEESMPEIVRQSVLSCKEKCPEEYEWVLITKENINEYLKIPDYIYRKVGKGMSLTHFSDYVRLCLLYKYGGVWADSTCYFTDSIPVEILSSEIFFFCSDDYVDCVSKIDEKVLTLYALNPIGNHSIHLGSSWFISASPGNHLIYCVKKMLEDYWKNNNELIEYFLVHSAFSFAISHDEKCRELFFNMMKCSNVEPHALQGCLLECENREELINICKRNSFVHKLTYKLDVKKNKNTIYDLVVSKGI